MKKTVHVNLSTTELVQSFVSALSELEGEFELVSGGYTLDGRSLMGIFSLDRTKPVSLNIYSRSDFNLDPLRSFITETGEVL